MDNRNLKRRGGLGLWALGAAPLVKPWLWLLRKNDASKSAPLTVFQSYLVGDLFMALPALKILARELDVRVVCRPDCVEILRAEGLEGIPFENVFFTRANPGSFFRTLRRAWKLRGRLGPLALDFDADPRTAFWLKIAGVRRAVSYARPYAILFDGLFPIPLSALHQADKNLAVASGFLERRSLFEANISAPKIPGALSKAVSSVPLEYNANPSAPWILSCWTRKDTKNWPLEKWDEFLERMLAARLPFRVLSAPDGDAAFRAFESRWTGKVEFLKGSLPEVAKAVQASSGIVATDNFIGQMASYYGRPLLWVNGSSDPRQVMPKEPQESNRQHRSQIGLVQVDPMPCRPCGHRCVNPEYKACLNRLTVDAVWTAFTGIARF